MAGRPPPTSLLTDSHEELLRQVHPSFLRDGRPSSQAFRPTKKDEWMLSVARGSLTTAEAAFRHHSEKLKCASAGTWGITVGECDDQDLKAYSDPIVSPPEATDLAHAFVDFRGMSNSQVEARGIKLARAAHERGALYRPSASGGPANE